MDGVSSLGVKNREFLKNPQLRCLDSNRTRFRLDASCTEYHHNKDYLIFKIPGSLYVFAV